MWQRAAASPAPDTAHVIQEFGKERLSAALCHKGNGTREAGSDRRPLATGGAQRLAEALLAGGWIPYQVETSAFGVKYIWGDVIHCK